MSASSLPSALAFDKYQGLGNDFVVVDGEGQPLSADQARALCDRHFGIGADGVLLLSTPRQPGSRATMVVFNADGSRPEMCGNGLRCAALHLARRDGLRSATFTVDTDAGPRLCQIEQTAGEVRVTLGMGRGVPGDPLLVEHGGRRLVFDQVSMGNPHAVLFEAGWDEARVDAVAPSVCASVSGGTNVHVATVQAPRELRVLVWERGLGRTLACGTGAAATVVAAARRGLVPFDVPVSVDLPGGRLAITVARAELGVQLAGPARHVFSGVLD